MGKWSRGSTARCVCVRMHGPGKGTAIGGFVRAKRHAGPQQSERDPANSDRRRISRAGPAEFERRTLERDSTGTDAP